EELALSLDQVGAAVRADALESGRLVAPPAAVGPVRYKVRYRAVRDHRVGPPSGAGVTVGSGPLFRTSPAGVRRASTGGVSGVGTTESVSRALPECGGPRFLRAQLATSTIMSTRTATNRTRLMPPPTKRPTKFVFFRSLIMPEFGLASSDASTQISLGKRKS